MSELYIKFGELLRLERERQGTTLANVSDVLKIAEDSLRDIEAGATTALPSELYFRMFSKSYAEHLGIDYARTIEAIREELGESLEEDTRDEVQSREKRKPDRSSEAQSEVGESAKGLRGNARRLVILASVVVGCFVIFLLAFQIFFGDGESKSENIGTDATAAEPGESADVDQTASANEAYDWNAPIYQPPDSISLTLIARQESWATVLADGDTALYQTLTPGRQYTLAARYRFLVSIGVPRVVDVMIDNRPAYLASAETGRISRVEIDQTCRDRFRSPAAPHTPATTTTATPETRTDNVDSTQQGGSDSI